MYPLDLHLHFLFHYTFYQEEYLFQYIDLNNKIHKINSDDVNQYIQNICHKDFTTKDFRTYASNRLFVEHIRTYCIPQTKKDIRLFLKNAVEYSANCLGHTKAVSKKSYIMQFLLEEYMNHPENFKNIKNIDSFLVKILKKFKKNLK